MQIPRYTKGIVRRRDTAPLTNFSKIDQAGMLSEAIGKVADIGAQMATKIKQADDLTSVNKAIIQRQKDDIDFREEAKKANYDNPKGYAKLMEQEYNARDKEFLNNLPSDEARKAYQDSVVKLNLRNYEEDLNWENRRTTEMFANKADDSIKDLEEMAYRGVNLDELAKNRQATAFTLGNVLSPDQIERFDMLAEQRITKSYLDGAISRNPIQAKKMLDSKKYDSALGVDNIKSLTDKANAAVESLQKEAIKQQEKIAKMQIEDPAGMAQLLGAQTPEDIILKQKEAGVVGSNISIIPKKEAIGLVNDFNGIQNSDQMKKALDGIRQAYGDKYYNIAMQDLKKNGLSQDITFIAQMNPKTDKQVMDAAFTMSKEGKNYTQLSKARGVTDRDITNKIENNIEDIRDVFLVEGGDVSGLNQKLENLATYFTANGMDVDSATKLSTNWLVNKSKIGTVGIGGNKFRIPNEYNIDTIEDALTNALENLNENDVNTIGTGQFSTAALKRQARFVLSSDEEYYYLKNQVGSPVLKRGTNEVLKFPITNIIQELKIKQEGLKSDKDKKAFIENLLGLQEE